MLAGQPVGNDHERIGRYEVLRKIATGGMAELFLAKQVGMEGFEKVVAIKRILSHLAYDDEFINMFRDEARIVAKLSHPNIVQIYDLGKSDETYFIAMEYIPGRNLSSIYKRARLKEEKLPSEYVGRCVAQACEGLYYAHTRKDIDGRPLQIVHRDVSPQNIIVSFSGTVKLVDFGIAKAATKIAHTRAGVLKGKYAYMSPEQIRGEQIDARSDLFAVGIVLYELLAGRRPFEKENSIQTLKAIVQEPHRDVREHNPDVPEGMAEIIDRALEKDPTRRYQDAQEVQIALEDFVSASPTRCNNITISKWVQGLFAEELSRERGGTVVFQGVGEVILPDVDESSDEEEEISDISEVPAAAEQGDQSQPLMLSRGRGGGSVDTRPPIPAPSNSLIESLGSWSEDSQPERRSLIQESVLPDREASTTDGGFDDDATVHALQAIPKRPPETPDLLVEDSIDRPITQEGYDDSQTEFGPTLHQNDAEETIRPDEDQHQAPTFSMPSVDAETDERHIDEIALAAGEAEEDLWEEATVGYDGVPPDAATFSPEAALAAPVVDPAPSDSTDEIVGIEPDESSFGDLSGSFSAQSDVWDDKTANNDAFLPSPEMPEPVVADYEDDEDSLVEIPEEEFDLEELYDAAEEASDESLQGDATIAAPSLSALMAEADAEVEAEDYEDDFEGDATIAGVGLSFPEEEASGLFSEEATMGVDEEEIDDGGWAADATIAGSPFTGDGPTIAGYDDDDDDEEFEVPMYGDVDPNAEPALPDGVDLSRDVNVDAATVAGVTTDYEGAGLGAPAHVYDPSDNFEVMTPAEDKGPSLGAIQLKKAAAAPTGGVVEAGFEDSSEMTVGTLDGDADVDKPISALDFKFEDDDLEGGELPSAVRPPPTQDANSLYESAQDEYSALVAPQPLNRPPPGEEEPQQAMRIGSTNVPPAALSLSEMLHNPQARVEMSAPKRSASMLGRQIREVVRTPTDVPPSVAPPPSMPAPEPLAPAAIEPLHDPELYNQHAMMHDAPPPAPARGRSRLLMAALIVLGVGCLAIIAYLFIETLVPSNQHLTIRTTPIGATVSVNDQPQNGKTPMTIKGLKPGVTYQIKLKRDGYVPVERPVRLPPNRPLIWQIPLKKAE